MTVRRLLRRAAMRVERALDRLTTLRSRRQPPLIEPYTGYATPETLVARGRVLTSLRRQHPLPEQGWLTNLRQMLLLFLTAEVSDVRVRALGTPAAADGGAEPHAISDPEGYFTLVVPRGGRDGGWTEVPAAIERSGERVALPVLVPEGGAGLAVVSDIDDTLMETGAYSLARNLWTSLTGNALTRHVFPDAVALLRGLSQGGRNPVFYVSSSPWNLNHFLQTVFERADLVRGPMFLRDIGISETPATAGPHGEHKGAAIDILMEANPTLPFWLVGDTGQHDAEIYLAAARRHPGRVARVALREPGPGPDAAARDAIEALRALGVSVTSGRDFAPVIAEIPSHDPSSAGTSRTPPGSPGGAPAADGRAPGPRGRRAERVTKDGRASPSPR